MANERTYDRQAAKGKNDMDVDAIEAEKAARQAAYEQADRKDYGVEEYTPEDWVEWEQLQEKRIGEAQDELNFLGQRAKSGKAGKNGVLRKGKAKAKARTRSRRARAMARATVAPDADRLAIGELTAQLLQSIRRRRMKIGRRKGCRPTCPAVLSIPLKLRMFRPSAPVSNQTSMAWMVTK